MADLTLDIGPSGRAARHAYYTEKSGWDDGKKQSMRPRYEIRDLMRKAKRALNIRPVPFMTRWQKRAHRRAVRAMGLLNWVQTCQAFAGLRGFEQTELGEKQMAREKVTAELTHRKVQNADGTVSFVVLSEARRHTLTPRSKDYPNAVGYNHEALAATDKRLAVREFQNKMSRAARRFFSFRRDVV